MIINRYVGNTVISLVEKYGYEWCDASKLEELLNSLYGEQREIQALILVKKQLIDLFYAKEINAKEIPLALEKVIKKNWRLKKELQWSVSIWMIALGETAPFQLETVTEPTSNTVKNSDATPKLNSIQRLVLNDHLNKRNNQSPTTEQEVSKVRIRKNVNFMVVTIILFVILVAMEKIPQNEMKSQNNLQEQEVIDVEREERILDKKIEILLNQKKSLAKDAKLNGCEFSLGDDLSQHLLRSKARNVNGHYIYNHDYDGCVYKLTEEGNKVIKMTKNRSSSDVKLLHMSEYLGEPDLHYSEGYFIVLQYDFNTVQLETVFNKLDNTIIQITIEQLYEVVEIPQINDHHNEKNIV